MLLVQRRAQPQGYPELTGQRRASSRSPRMLIDGRQTDAALLTLTAGAGRTPEIARDVYRLHQASPTRQPKALLVESQRPANRIRVLEPKRRPIEQTRGQ